MCYTIFETRLMLQILPCSHVRQERASKFYQEKTAKEEHLETVKRAKEEKDAQKQEKENAVKRFVRGYKFDQSSKTV